jgi:hypothetical protein
MGFTSPDLPAVDPDTFLQKPLMERLRILGADWAENGFGSPKMVHTIYILKLVVFFAIGGVVVATLTSGVPAFWHVSEWWNQPIVYQKVIVWTVLLEAIGVAGSWGPLAGKVKPMTGGILFWARPGTIRLRPWKWVPFTNGDRRTVLDVVLYFALLASLVVALVSPGVHSDSLSAAVPDNTSGLVNPALLVAPMVLLVVIGLRDKTIFLASRGEQYLPALVFFTVLPFVNMIIALKMLIVVVWVLSLPFWFCDCGRRPAARKATACTGSCTWWHTRSPASGILTEWVFAAVRGSPTVPRMNNDPPLISQARQQFYNGKVGPPTVNPASRGTTGAPNRSTTGYARSAGTATTGPTSGKHR